ncbi:MAG: c-type cytochrome biogenesis protein CcmI [Pseudomonadota bacterium]
MFWIVTPVLILVAALFVVVPLLLHLRRANHDQTSEEQQARDEANLAIFEERLAELQTEYDEGAFDDQQFDSLKAELERSLLSDVRPEALRQVLGDEGDSVAVSPAPAGTGRGERISRLVPVLLVVLVVPPLSYLLYEMWGFREDLAFTEVVERSQQVLQDQEAGSEQIMAVASDLAEVIEREPENGWAYYFMARILTEIGQLEPARTAFQRAAEHVEGDQDRAVILGQYAQIEYLAQDREMTESVQDIINRAQRINPNERAVLQLLGSDAFLNEDYQGAITYWQRLLSMGATSSDQQFLSNAIAQARQMLEEQGGAEAVQGPVINVALSLAQGVNLAPETRVFISAQAVGGGGPPLAAQVLTVADLPATVRLSPAEAVGPRDLTSADAVNVVATASLSGTADVSSGDWQGRVENVTLPDEEENEENGEDDGPVTVDVELRIATQVD